MPNPISVVEDAVAAAKKAEQAAKNAGRAVHGAEVYGNAVRNGVNGGSSTLLSADTMRRNLALYKLRQEKLAKEAELAKATKPDANGVAGEAPQGAKEHISALDEAIRNQQEAEATYHDTSTNAEVIVRKPEAPNVAGVHASSVSGNTPRSTSLRGFSADYYDQIRPLKAMNNPRFNSIIDPVLKPILEGKTVVGGKAVFKSVYTAAANSGASQDLLDFMQELYSNISPKMKFSINDTAPGRSAGMPFAGLHVMANKATPSHVIIHTKVASQGSSGYFLHTFLHEYVHNISVDLLAKDKQVLNDVEYLKDQLYAYADSEFYKAHGHHLLLPGNSDFYGLTNAQELVAEAYTKPVFQNLIQKAGLWPDFVKIFAQHFKVEPRLLSAVMAIPVAGMYAEHTNNDK